MSFWKFCERLQNCGNSIETICQNYNEVFNLYFSNKDIEFVSNYLKQLKIKDFNVS